APRSTSPPSAAGSTLSCAATGSRACRPGHSASSTGCAISTAPSRDCRRRRTDRCWRGLRPRQRQRSVLLPASAVLPRLAGGTGRSDVPVAILVFPGSSLITQQCASLFSNRERHLKHL